MFNYNISSLGTGSRTTAGIVPLSGTAAVGSTPTGVIDTSNTDWVAVAVTVTGSATAQVETSFDNGTNWYQVYVIKGSDSTTTPTITASGLYFGNSIGAITRVNVTAVSGTFAITGGTTDVTNAPNGTPGSLTATSAPNATPAVPFSFTVAASTNAAQLKGTAGVLTELEISNLAASPIYVKLFNKVGTPVPGTDTPATVIPVAANTTTIVEFGTVGKKFGSGIGIAVTGAAAAADTTAATAGGIVSGTYV